jgi:hypothetical protein
LDHIRQESHAKNISLQDLTNMIAKTGLEQALL